MIVRANAKINLTLDILGVRADGFHEVAMVMQSIALCDEVFLEKAEEISLSVDLPGLEADERNLAWRAAELMRAHYGIRGGAKIALKKKIPMAAGLAGGSADAAAVLRGMNALYEIGADAEELAALGAEIGSDIPFCVLGGTMLAEGRGEFLRRIAYAGDCPVVLAKPPVGVSTAWAYRAYDENPAGEGEHPDNAAMESALREKNWKKAASFLCNVMERATIKKYDEIAQYKEIMRETGALGRMMSGSGPTVFALAESMAQAEEIARALKERTEAAVFVTHTTDAFHEQKGEGDGR